MYIWSLIPARAGSVRIEHKNMRELAERRLIDYPILASLAWQQAQNTVISTNDLVLKAYCQKYSEQGVIVSTRPEEYAQGDIPITVWITDLIRKSARKPDIIAYLQPTSPFVDPKKLRLALDILQTTAFASVQTVSLVPHNYHSYNQRVIDYTGSEDPRVKFKYEHDRLRAFNAAAKPNHYKFGNFVMFRVSAMKEQGTVFAEPSFPMEIERGYDVDINGEFDFKLAEWYLQTGVVELEHLNEN